MKELAASLSAAMDVVQRLLIWVGLALILVAPGWIPLLDRFVLETTEINILGQTFKVTDTRQLPGAKVAGLAVEDGKVKLNGEDISLLPGERDRLRQQVSALEQEKLDLIRKLEDASQQLADLARAPAAPAQQGQIARLAQSTGSAAETALQAIAALPTAAAPPPAVPAPGPLPIVVLGGDASAAAAADEARKASDWARGQSPAPPVRIYLRNGSYRTTVAFASPEAAQAALPSLRKAFATGPYAVDLRSWCPAAISATPRQEAGVAVIDCRF